MTSIDNNIIFIHGITAEIAESCCKLVNKAALATLIRTRRHGREFKCLGVLYMGDVKMEQEMDRRFGTTSLVMRLLYRAIVVNKELGNKTNLSIYWSVYIPTITSDTN